MRITGLQQSLFSMLLLIELGSEMMAQVSTPNRPSDPADSLAWLMTDEPLALRRMEEVRSGDVRPAVPLTRGTFRVRSAPGKRFNPTLAEEFQKAIDSVRSVAGTRGVIAAVSLPDEGMWVGASGHSTSDPLVAADPDMLFAIASNTKSFVSAVLASLAVEGALSLDDSLHRFLPALPNVDSTITIRQLLSMRTGVWDFFNDWPDGRAGQDCRINPNVFWKPESTITTYVSTPHFPAGSAYRYSNTNYLLAGMIIRNVTGGSVSAAIRSRLLNPAGLAHTYLDQEEQFSESVMHPWQGGTDWSYLPRTAYYSMIWTAGALFSTAENVCQWVRVLNEGTELTDSARSMMHSFEPVDGVTDVMIREYGYGLGIERMTEEGRLFIGHTGGMPGYLSLMYYMPDRRMSVVVFINQRPSSTFWGYLRALTRVVLSKTPTNAASPNVLYAASGASESGVLHSGNPSTGVTSSVGPYRYPDILDLSIDSSTKQLIAVMKNRAYLDVVRIDPTTAQTYPVRQLPFQTNVSWTTAAMAGDSAVYAAMQSRWLFKHTVGNPAAEYVTDTHLLIQCMTVHPVTGELWVSVASASPDSIDAVYALSLPSGSARRIGSTGFGEPILDLQFDFNGTLRALTGHSGSSRKLIVVDTSTGAGTLVSTLDVDDVTTFALRTDGLSSSVRDQTEVPSAIQLSQNYPNPFNPETEIRYQIADVRGQRSALRHVRLSIYDLLGRERAVLVNEEKPAGVYSVRWNATGMPSGVYFYRLQVGSSVLSSKMILGK